MALRPGIAVTRLRFGVRAKLMLLTLLGLLPLVGLHAYNTYSRLQDRVDVELGASREFASATSAAFINHLESLWDASLVIGTAITLPGVPLGEPDIHALLRHQLRAQPTVTELAWIDPSGAVTASTGPRPSSVWVGEQEVVRRVLAGQDRAVSDLVRDPFKGEPALVAIRAVRRDGRLQGLVAAVIDPHRLGSALPVERRGAGTFGLVDRNALLVYYNADPDLPFERRLIGADSPSRLALGGQTTVSPRFGASVDQPIQMGAAVPIARIGWAAFATAPIDGVLAVARADTTRDLVALLWMAAAALAGALLAGNLVLRPILALRQAALAISQGDLSARVGIGGADEVAAAAQTFDQMADRLAELQSARTRFVHIAAHELRNPLTAIRGLAALLRRRARSGDPVGDVEQVATVIESEAERLAAFVNEIVDGVRVQGGELAVRRERIDLTEVVRAALHPFRTAAERHRFLVDGLELGPVWVIGDVARLGQVLRNLLGNAVKYSPDGGEIRVAVHAGERQARLSVRDDGGGIPADELGQVFNSFFRASNLGGRDPGGVGLGLYICKEIVQLHGGRIWAESNAGGGAAFHVELPLPPPQNEDG